MKRPIAPFAVEYKRRPKLSKTSETSLWSGSIGKELKNLLNLGHDDGQISPADKTVVPSSQPQTGSHMTPPGKGGDGQANNKRPGRILETREPAFDSPSVAMTIKKPVAASRSQDGAATPISMITDSILSKMPSRVRPAITREPMRAETDRSDPKPVSPFGPTLPGPARAPSEAVARRRARTKGLDFQDRWKWDLLRSPVNGSRSWGKPP